MATKQIIISLQGKNELKGAFSSAVNDIKKLQQESKRASTQVKNDFSSLGKGIKINSSGLFNKIVSEGKSAVNSLKNAFSGLGGAIASIFAGVSLAELVQSAGNAESKWNRIAAYTGTTGQNLKNQKVDVRALADHYGVVNGELSAVYETNLRFFGDQQKSMKFAAGIAATSKTTGQDMVTIQNAIMSGELGRNRQLQRSVLTEAQRNKYLADGELTQEEIGQLLAENEAIVANNPALIEDANSEWSRMESSIASLKVSLGKALLPIVKSLVPIISQVADTFTSLNSASGGLLGIFTGIGLAAASIAAPLGMAWPALTAMKDAATTLASKIWEYVNGLRTASTVPAPAGTTGGPTTGQKAAVGAGGIVAAVAIDQLAQQVIAPKLSEMFQGMGIGEGLAGASSKMISPGGSIGSLLRQGSLEAGGDQQLLYNIFGKNSFQKMLLDQMQGVDFGKILGGGGAGQGILKALEGPFRDAGNNIKNWWNGLGGWFGGLFARIGQIAGETGAYLSGAWANTMAFFQGIANSAIGGVLWLWNTLSGAVSRGVAGTVSVFQSGLQWIYDTVRTVWDMVSRGVSGVVNIVASITGGGGPGGPMGPGGNISQARGLNYQGYAGHQKNPFEALLYGGNCVDMSLGLIGMAGTGSLVSGTYRGSPHVWANIGGKDYDPARRALEGTWTPPARGPGGSGTIVIYGDVYGYKDFAKKVEGTLNRIV
jgi:hypothetical protein